MTKRILSEIWIYPVKSLGGIRLTSSEVREKGLLYDRRWMLIDENDVFMTQREHNKMALFKVSFKDDGFEIRFGSDSIHLPFVHEVPVMRISTNVWDDKITAVEVKGDYNRWFSERLGVTCRLVFFPEDYSRPVDPKRAINDEHVSLADGYPFLIIGQSSLDDLNGRLRDPLPMNRFRPNLVFTGGEPYEEDDWKEFIIGHNKFAGVKPCARCVMITINQATAERGKEPLSILARYRGRDGKVFFGQNVLSLDHNEIYEGDEITLN